MRHPPLRRCNSRNTHLCLGEGKRHDFRLFHTMEQMCLIAFQQREQLTDENMGGIVLVDTLRLFCCQLIENLLEALRNFVTPIFRKAAVPAEKPQKELHTDLQEPLKCTVLSSHGFVKTVAFDAVLLCELRGLGQSFRPPIIKRYATFRHSLRHQADTLAASPAKSASSVLFTFSFSYFY